MLSYLSINLSLSDSFNDIYCNKYPKFTQGINSMKKKIIEEEVLKFTSGCNQKVKEFFDWKPKYDIGKGIEEMIKKFLFNIKE